MTEVSAASSGQGLGVTYAFTAPLPKPASGQVIKVSQMFSVVVTDTVPITTNVQPSPVKDDGKKAPPVASSPTQPQAPVQAVVATDQAVLKANATLSPNSSDALVSALALTGSTTVIAGEGVTPVTAHAVGAAGGAGLTSTQAPIPSATPSSATTSPIEINQTLTVKAETVIADTAKIPQSQNTTDKKIEQPTQTVALSASSSPVPPQNSSVTAGTTPPLHAETTAQGTSTTNVNASSPDMKQTGTPSKDAPSKDPTQDTQKQNVTPSPTAPVKETAAPSAPSTSTPSATSTSTPSVNSAAPSNSKNAPTTPSTAQANAGASGGAATGSGTLTAGAGAEAQSASQSAGPSQSAPAQAAASGGATAGAGASSVSPSQTATASGVSLASTGATLQKTP
jgi:hypothetical protein